MNAYESIWADLADTALSQSESDELIHSIIQEDDER